MPKNPVKEKYFQLLRVIVRGSIVNTINAHGEPLLPDSVAKRVAAQLYAFTAEATHKDSKSWVRHVRASLGLTQSRFAELIGTTQITVCRWEQGEPDRHRLIEPLLSGSPARKRLSCLRST